jgi:pimeloyl-ACP methyl ester carboxylesterase
MKTSQDDVSRSTFLSVGAASTAVLGATLLGSAIPALAAAKPSIVLCHGIFADGSSFNKIIPLLQARGYDVLAAQYGLDTPEGDVAAVIRTLGRVKGPVVLAGHSYGGTVITAAGTDPRVKALVYINALAPDADETSASLIGKFPPTEVAKYFEVQDGRLWLAEAGIGAFAGDLSAEEQKVVYATSFAPAADLFGKDAPGVAWKTKPSWYIVGTEDKTVNPELERFVAKRMGAHVTELASSHVSMLSHPQAVVDVILQAAQSVSSAT